LGPMFRPSKHPVDNAVDNAVNIFVDSGHGRPLHGRLQQRHTEAMVLVTNIVICAHMARVLVFHVKPAFSGGSEGCSIDMHILSVGKSSCLVRLWSGRHLLGTAVQA